MWCDKPRVALRITFPGVCRIDLASGNLHAVGCRYRCIISDRVSSHLSLRCRLNLSRVFRYQFCQQTKIRRSESRTLVPPNQATVPVPDLSIGSSQSLGAFGYLLRNRSGRPGTPAQRKGRNSRVLVGRFWAPACRRLGLPSCS